MSVDVAACNRLAIARFSRWCRRTVRVPRSADDPKGYLTAVAAALREGRYDALLPTHEQAWLFAAGRHLLPADAPLAVADIEAFDQIQGKVACCRLLDAVGMPQPAWTVVAAAGQLLLRPGRAQALAAGAVREYAVPPAAVDIVRV